MDESANEASNAPTTVRQLVASPCVCKVCGDSAQYSYYGAIVCYSCKVFFRRNARDESAKLQCRDYKNCEIDINTRRLCSYCRLAKCFVIGMCAELIRGSLTQPPPKRPKTANTARSTSTALVRVNQGNQPELIPTLNLLRADQSTLSVDQWNRISNLVNCFDTYSGLPFIRRFIDEQTALPPKFRFKYTSVKNFFPTMLSNVQLVFERNRDLLSLSSHDRALLLRHTVEYTTSMGAAVLLRQAQLFDYPAFSESAELIFRPPAVAFTKRLIEHLEPDISFMKMICAIIAFLASNYTTYASTASGNLTDLKAIMRIQDTYTELVWRYLLYKHNHHDAVLCFSNLVRCLFLMHSSVVEAHEARQYTDIMDTVIETAEQRVTPEN